MSTIALSNRTSEVIKAARFPLILLVLFAHATIWTHTASDPNATSEIVYKYVTDLMSFNLGRLAVPVFFVLSGYFFFWNLDNETVKFSWFLGRWKKRARTLLIPYIIWNVIFVVAIIAKNAIFAYFGKPDDEIISFYANSSFLQIFWNGPANLPLWYMRNLICMSLIAPALYFVLRKLKWPSLILLSAFYFIPITYEFPGINFRSVMFFSIGAWLGIHKYDLLELCQKVRIPSFILAGIALLVSSYFTGTPHHEYSLRYLWLFGIIAFFNIIDAICANERIKTWLIKMSKYVFFIYAAHEIYILGWTKGGLLRLLGSSLPAEYIQFFTIPIVVTLVCIALYEILDKICPRILRFSLGGRK